MTIHLSERFGFYSAIDLTSEPISERVRDVYSINPLLSLIGFYSLYARAWGRPQVSTVTTCYKIYTLLGVALHKMLQLTTTCYKSTQNTHKRCGSKVSINRQLTFTHEKGVNNENK